MNLRERTRSVNHDQSSPATHDREVCGLLDQFDPSNRCPGCRANYRRRLMEPDCHELARARKANNLAANAKDRLREGLTERQALKRLKRVNRYLGAQLPDFQVETIVRRVFARPQQLKEVDPLSDHEILRLLKTLRERPRVARALDKILRATRSRSAHGRTR
jgi:hypothetical protein